MRELTGRNTGEYLGYLNGQLDPASQLQLSVFDQGIVHGFAVTEMLRTFCGKLYELEAHLKRLKNSARLSSIPLRLSGAEICEIAGELARHNFDVLQQKFPKADTSSGCFSCELGMIISATPGLNPTYTGFAPEEPTLFLHTFELPGELWAKSIAAGQHLAVSHVPQVPAECLPVAAKTRSRMSWILADQDVSRRYPGARAVVLDQQGFVRETSTANIFCVTKGCLQTPAAETVLPGISRQVVLEIARELNIPVREAALSREEFLQAEEIFTTSTPYCLLGVSQIDGCSENLHYPGKVTQAILEQWNRKVGIDIHQQLLQIAEVRRQSAQ